MPHSASRPGPGNAPAIKQVLCAQLWEEIRPVQKLELTWPGDAKGQPLPGELAVTTLDNRSDGSSWTPPEIQSAASSWWHYLIAVKQAVKPAVSGDGKTYVYDLGKDTCGIVVSVGGARSGSDYDVPAVRVLVAETWKMMDVEIEWGFDPTAAGKDYSGRAETYDGMVAGLRPLDGDAGTTAIAPRSWRSIGKGGTRRGVKLSLLYMGTSKWRRVQSYTSWPDDVARTIVTLWTQAGNFSFLAADLEKVRDAREIAASGVLVTPGLMINGKVVSVGKIPSEEEIKIWLAGLDN